MVGEDDSLQTDIVGCEQEALRIGALRRQLGLDTEPDPAPYAGDNSDDDDDNLVCHVAHGALGAAFVISVSPCSRYFNFSAWSFSITRVVLFLRMQEVAMDSDRCRNNPHRCGVRVPLSE